ncbi:MAG: tRNA-(ms[2]io[6]A)-hydroxylase [Cyanobacteriota bacterium]|nr:tRNA-(ms[2]io[6]A)-hydroxylase [Cyanobacteriota bacterium]
MAAVSEATARVKWLLAPTSPGWVRQAIARPDLLLIDHAHCERKAAGVALQLMFRYPSDGELAERLSPLAREELAHFERVWALMRRRHITPRPLVAPAYGAALKARVRREEPFRLLDSLLVAGLIEARSHERMALLAVHSPDQELRELHGDLLASEARHFGLYWLLCETRFGREATVERLEPLARAEWEALLPEHPDDAGGDRVRMHSPGVLPCGGPPLAVSPREGSDGRSDPP